MLYVGWDIGIKNLAYCIVDSETNKQTIIELDIINLITIQNTAINYCSQMNKNGKKCKSKATYKHKIEESIFFCNKHYNNVIESKTYCKKTITKIKIKKIKANLVPLETLGKKLFEELDKNPLFMKCENIIIENQPVLKNPKMKSIQIMLYSYFLIRNKNINAIQLINASNKLKVYKGKLDSEIDNKLKLIKDKYKKNKMTAIEHCRKIMELNKENKFIEEFDTHKKKDDLADAYLMCQYFIGKHNK